jgi:diguanylate cyclase (GGDEF)-like protein
VDETQRDGERGGAAARCAAVADDTAATRNAALEKLVAQYRVLLETSAVISAETDIDEVLAKITRLATQCMNVAWCDVYEVAPGNDDYVVVAYYQLPELELDSSEWVGTVYNADTFIDMQICATERRAVTLYRDDPALTAAVAAELDRWGELADLTVPLVYRRQLIGLIGVGESRSLRRFSDDEVRVLQAIADQAAIAIVNARTIKRLEDQAVTDDLTGLYNRRHLEQRLCQEVARARRYAEDLSVLMLDLDEFKHFNDTFGHLPGDKLLRELAAIIRREVRQEVDVVARCGGDEFVIVMPLMPVGDEDVGAALAVAERLRAAVAAHAFEGWPGRRDEHITLSIGVASVADVGDPADSVGTDTLSDEASASARVAAVLLAVADKALYMAKRQGRDRVCRYQSS